MNIDTRILKTEEGPIFKLRELYHKYGYSQYKMSKFEEYDLYARNKDFLISGNVITFTDTNGKLMALKPDVTLSIVRNSRDGGSGVQKVYYNENVYRVSGNTHAFQEIPQIGVECLGKIGGYDIAEILLLAVSSLRSISEDSKLYLSHLDILSNFIDQLGLPRENYAELVTYIGQKNIHEMTKLCEKAEADMSVADKLKTLLLLNGSDESLTGKLRDLGCHEESVEQLEMMLEILKQNGFAEKICVDFSIVSDMKYYNGIAFKGFVSGVPTSVLSGGQYNKLMRKMGRSSDAIGFAVYLDMLERLNAEEESYDADVVLLYDETSDPRLLTKTVRQMTELGLRVVAQREIPEKFSYKQLVRFNGNEVETFENNA